MKETIAYVVVILSFLNCLGAFAQSSQGSLLAWGKNKYGIISNVPAGDNYIQVSAGNEFTVALKADGSLAAWGYNGKGQCNVPPGNDYVHVGAGAEHCVALKNDGSLAAWGANDYGQCDVPTGNDYIYVDANFFYNVAQRADGSLVAWGSQGSVPPGNDYIQIAGWGSHNVALKADGSIVVWGYNGYGLNNVPPGNDYIQVEAGNYHNVALKADGSLVAWGRNDFGQCNVPPGNDFIQVDAGYFWSIALKADGSLVAWGWNNWGQCDVPPGNDYVQISTKAWHGVAIYVSNTPPIANAGNDQTLECAPAAGAPVTLDGSGSSDPDGDPLNYTWKEGATVLGAGEMLTLTLAPGVHTITLTVDDGNGGTDDDEVIFTINADTGPPVISLNGDNPLTLIRFSGPYAELGAIVTDNCDLNPSLVISGTVDTNLPGQYTITYNASDANSNTAQATRTVDVIDDPNAWGILTCTWPIKK